MHLDIPKLLNELTLEEKISLLSGANFWNTQGIERLDIPSIMLTDGPHGLRKQSGAQDNLGLNSSVPATCFPTASALASSWDTGLVEEVGRAIGREAAHQGVSVVLGPGLNIIRNPLGGRTFEYFSEDPLLAGDMAASLTRGIQLIGIAACLKHFAVNSQETVRMTVNEIVDERALHEIYLEGFRRAVKFGAPKAVMTAYNRVNGVYANENTQLLTTNLRDQWGYRGLVVTDWGGEHDRVAGLNAGNQLEMPASGHVSRNEIHTGLATQKLTHETLDKNVRGILELINSTRVVNPRQPDLDAHHRLAVRAAEKSAVLLRNNNGILPLAKGERVAVIGDFAATPRYQGAGSSLVNPTRLDSALKALNESKLNITGYAPGFKRFGGRSRRLINRAVDLAAQADVAVVFMGLDEASEAEGVDRPHMRLNSNQLELLEHIKRVQHNIVVVLANGAPVELPFINSVDAVLLSHLGGQGGGTAVANILTGKTNPSGKLAVTYPLRYSDVPSYNYYPGTEDTAEHRESIYVGYRYYETRRVDVEYPFGHGLSYTEFRYSNLRVLKTKVELKIKNTGDVAGEEIVQIYIEPPIDSKFFASIELAGFTKVQLKPGEEKLVTITLSSHAFKYYNTRTHDWEIQGGTYQVSARSSVRDVRLVDNITLTGTAKLNTRDVPNGYLTGNVRGATTTEFGRLAGYKMPPENWNRNRRLTKYDSMAQFKYANIAGRSILGLLHLAMWAIAKAGKPIEANNLIFVINMPLYKYQRLSMGKITDRRIELILKLVNLGK